MLLKIEDIYLDKKFKNKKDAIESVGQIMIDKGYVDKKYVKSMIKRDKVASVAIGNYLAIPHSEQDGFEHIKENGIIFIKLSEPLMWDEQEIKFVIGLAVGGDQQMDALQEIAIAFSDSEEVENFYKNINEEQDVLNYLAEQEI